MANLPGCFGWGVIKITTEKLFLGQLNASLIAQIVGRDTLFETTEHNTSHVLFLAHLLASLMQHAVNHESFLDAKFDQLKIAMLSTEFWTTQLKLGTSYAMLAAQGKDAIPPPSVFLRMIHSRPGGRSLDNFALEKLGSIAGYTRIQLFLPMQLALHFGAQLQSALEENHTFGGHAIRKTDIKKDHLVTCFASGLITVPACPFHDKAVFPHYLTPEQERRLACFLSDNQVDSISRTYFSIPIGAVDIPFNVGLAKRNALDKVYPDPTYANMDHFLSSLSVLPCLPQHKLPEPFLVPSPPFQEFLDVTLNNLQTRQSNRQSRMRAKSQHRSSASGSASSSSGAGWWQSSQWEGAYHNKRSWTPSSYSSQSKRRT